MTNPKSKTTPQTSVLDHHRQQSTNAALAVQQATPRFTPIVDIPGFSSAAGDAGALAAAGVTVGIYGGVAAVRYEDTRRAVDVIEARRRTR
jgi:hypothetical protein